MTTIPGFYKSMPSVSVTLGEDHGKVIQYIFPDLYVNGFDLRSKSH